MTIFLKKSKSIQRRCSLKRLVKRCFKRILLIIYEMQKYQKYSQKFIYNVKQHYFYGFVGKEWILSFGI